jgi:hypothetical protein
MTLRGKKSEDSVELVASGDGTASLQLREVENEGVVSRRGVMWRAGLATAAGVGVLSVLDQQRAEAATGGNFILGNANNANSTTELHPTAASNSSPLFQVNGSALSGTSTTMFVNGPGGGAGLGVSGASTATTVGLAINGTGSGSATGVFGGSSSGTGIQGSSGSGVGVRGSSSSSTGVYGTSSSGIGVRAVSTTGAALHVTGRAHFSRSGAASVGQGHKTRVVNVAGVTASSLVLVTMQTTATGVFLAGAVPGSGKFTVKLNKNAPTNMKFSWFVLN